MAAIDKLYIKTWDQYTQLKEWCAGKVCWDKPYLDYKGRTVEKLYAHDFLFDWEKKDWGKGGKPVFNAPIWFDIWLIQNCPLDFIQVELKDMYGDDDYNKLSMAGTNSPDMFDQMKAGTSAYHKWGETLASRKKATKFVEEKGPVYYGVIRDRWNSKNGLIIEIDDPQLYEGKKVKWYYNDANDCWVTHYDLSPLSETWSGFAEGRHYNKHWLKRKLKKWNLPTGITLKVTNEIYIRHRRYLPQTFDVKLK